MNFRNWFALMKQAAYKGARFVDTPRGSVHYTDIGEGPVVLHSHGSPAGADTGPLFFRDLTREGYRLLTPSRPGFLGTHLSLGRSVEAQADVFKSFLDALNVEKVVLHAWSGGGPPAIAFAIKYPESLHGLILYCAVAHRWDHRITLFERMLLSDRAIWMLWNLSKLFPEAFRKKSAQELGVDYDYVKQAPERLALLDKFFEMTAPPSLRNPGSFNDIEAYSAMDAFDFSRVRVPTLVLFSPSDNQLPISHGDLPAAQIEGAAYLRFAHGGHMPMIDKDAGLVSGRMLEFMRALQRHEV
jgi:pimeloyl-ACP methyl ester carboxylesterase